MDDNNLTYHVKVVESFQYYINRLLEIGFIDHQWWGEADTRGDEYTDQRSSVGKCCAREIQQNILIKP
jgi:hypothetical protein